MSEKIYTGVNGVAKEVKKIYVGVNGVAKQVKKAYVGVNNVAQLCYKSEQPPVLANYLTSDGNQFIETDYYVKSNSIISAYVATNGDTRNKYFFGCAGDSTHMYFRTFRK